VVNDLEIPQQLARLSVDGHKRGAEQIIAGAIHADAVVVRGSEGHVEDTARHVDRHVSPDVYARAVLPAIPSPGLMSRLSGKRHGVEGPDKFACLRIPGACVTCRTQTPSLAAWSFAGACTSDYQVLVDGGRGRQDIALVHAGPHYLWRFQINHAVHAEVPVELASRRADGVHPAPARSKDDCWRGASISGPVRCPAQGSVIVIRDLEDPLLVASG